jgi:GNAT superfamily N-acetyltransferase
MNRMPHSIRLARPDDVPAVAGILRELGWFAHVAAEPPAATEERIARHLDQCQRDDSHLVLVAEAGGQVAGYCAVHWIPYLTLAGPEGFVSELFVGAPFRGQGIGRQLLATVQAEARRRGCCRLMLMNLRKRESYQRQFYPKQGWEERAEAANFLCWLR